MKFGLEKCAKATFLKGRLEKSVKECTHHFIMTVLHGNDAFSVSVLSTRKRYSRFPENLFSNLKY